MEHINGSHAVRVRKFRGATLLSALAALGSLTVDSAAAQSAPVAERVEIRLANFRFDPAEIRLTHGHRYLLHFVNTSGSGHDFVSERFFAAAAMAPGDHHKVPDGEVELDGNGEASVTLTAPVAGDYEFHCSHFLHQTFGMKGRFIVQ
jgi:plastocyanin